VSDVPIIGGAHLEIIAPDMPSHSVPINQCPFLIGRGSGNQLQLSGGRISRTAAAILIEDGLSLAKILSDIETAKLILPFH